MQRDYKLRPRNKEEYCSIIEKLKRKGYKRSSNTNLRAIFRRTVCHPIYQNIPVEDCITLIKPGGLFEKLESISI